MRTENSYTRAKREHDRHQLQAHYNRNSQRSIGITEYVEDEYTKFRHYTPHGIGLGGLVIVGGLLIMAYNQSNRDYFDSIYFSSW